MERKPSLNNMSKPMQQLEPGWHLQVQTGMELIEKQGLMTWKESADSFCNLPKYEQQVYCKELKRIGEAKAKAIEDAEIEANKLVDIPEKKKSVSERVIEWHQKNMIA